MNQKFLTGFTLIELLVYITVIGLVLTTTVIFVWQIVQGEIKIQSQREVRDNLNFAMGKITLAIRNGLEVVNINEPGQSDSSLELAMQDAAKTPTRFELSQNEIRMKEAGGQFFPLTSERVLVTNLEFTNLSFDEGPAAIKVEMTLEYNNPAGRPEYAAAANLENTITLRY